jgi:hypothetical protein
VSAEIAVFIQLLESDDAKAIVQRLNDAAFAATTAFFVQSLDKLVAGAELTTQEEAAATALQNAVASSPVVDQALQQLVVQVDEASVAGVGTTIIRDETKENSNGPDNKTFWIIFLCTCIALSAAFCSNVLERNRTIFRGVYASPAAVISHTTNQTPLLSVVFQNMRLSRANNVGGTACREACTYGEARAILGVV